MVLNTFLDYNRHSEGLQQSPFTETLLAQVTPQALLSAAFGTGRKAACPEPLREQELNTTEHDFSAALTSLKPVPGVEVRLSRLMPCSH